MNLIWNITEEDIKLLNDFYKKNSDNPFIKNRIKRNQLRDGIVINKEIFWHAIVSCLLTTQQRSGPGSPISFLIREDPFPLSLEACQKQNMLSIFIEEVLSSRNGIRFTKKIPDFLDDNFKTLNESNWSILDNIIEYFNSKINAKTERVLAENVSELLKGFGPKQSRNLLQTLGVTQYEIPVDSRITKWLNDFGFPIKITAKALSDINYYNFIMDGIIILCEKAWILPCVFDAAIFASYDSGWTENNIIW